VIAARSGAPGLGCIMQTPKASPGTARCAALAISFLVRGAPIQQSAVDRHFPGRCCA
jgi:hypothetical protein